MAFPPGISPKTVTIGIGSFYNGDLVQGRATITAPVNVVHTPSNRPIFSGEMPRVFVDGEASWNLVPTDTPGLNRKDWTYKLKVEIAGALVQPDPIYFTLPVNGPDTVDLDGLVTVPSSAGIPVSVDVLTAEDFGPLMAEEIGDTASATSVALRAAFESKLPRSGAVAGQVPVLQPDGSLAFAQIQPPQYDVFTTNGTWTKPSWATVVRVLCIGPGGGGGSGRRTASGTIGGGGGGGGGGGYSIAQFRAGDLGPTEAVVVGTGGAGGAAVSVDSTNGNPGATGSAGTSFGGSKVTAGRGFGGSGGIAGAGGGGGFGVALFNGTAGSTSSATGAAGGSANQSGAAAGGGSGGGLATTPVAVNGGAGVASSAHGTSTLGAAGVAPGGNGGSATDPGNLTTAYPGASGGGGASSITAAAGSGGNGGRFGGGGGGGGASLNGFNSGAGGNGADGLVVIISE